MKVPKEFGHEIICYEIYMILGSRFLDSLDLASAPHKICMTCCDASSALAGESEYLWDANYAHASQSKGSISYTCRKSSSFSCSDFSPACLLLREQWKLRQLLWTPLCLSA